MSPRFAILIVDDSTMMRAVIKRAVQMTGADVEIAEAANGREALDVLEARPVDAVFTDINMPVMSGPELLREMTHRGWSHIRRVVVSTDGSGARREEVRALEVSLYINKPFAPEAVRDVLAQLCPHPAGA
ncbi:MAG: response regulator [Acidobacteria bacterium]|nr:response regulator [Acidobacteriota bacterium]